MLDEAEVRHLDAVADEEEVARLDVEVLEVVLLVHVVERLGRVADVAQQLVARDADQAGRQAFLIAVVQALVRHFHDDDQLALDDLDAVHGEDEGMADFLDAVEGVQLLFGPGAVDVERIEVAEDELDRLEQAARRLAFPDFAEAAAAERLDQAIARDRLRIGLAHNTHG